MEIQEYQTLFLQENDYWWYVGLRALVFSYLNGVVGKRKNLKILDAGCGTGGILERCKDFEAYGLDISEEAIKYLGRRNLRNVIRASVCEMPFENDAFDLVISLDVLYHLGVRNDSVALNEFYRILKKNSVLILHVPAYEFLRSDHDIAIHTRQRYTIEKLKSKVEMAGFSIHKITYRNTFLFPLAGVMRLAKKMSLTNRAKAKSDLRYMPFVLNNFLSYILLLENRILSVLNLPFGLSIFCVARKN